MTEKTLEYRRWRKGIQKLVSCSFNGRPLFWESAVKTRAGRGNGEEGGVTNVLVAVVFVSVGDSVVRCASCKLGRRIRAGKGSLILGARDQAVTDGLDLTLWPHIIALDLIVVHFFTMLH